MAGAFDKDSIGDSVTLLAARTVRKESVLVAINPNRWSKLVECIGLLAPIENRTNET